MPITLLKPTYLLIWLLIPLIWLLFFRIIGKKGAWQRSLWSGVLRSLLIVTLGLALADPRILIDSDHVNLFFCIDVSESIGVEGEKIAKSFIEEASTGMKEEDRAGVILFAEKPSFEGVLGNTAPAPEWRSDLSGTYTNIYKALELAIGKMPEKGLNRIILMSDGNQNLNDAVDIAYIAKSLGIEIHSLPLSSWFGKNEVYLESLKVPDTMPLETPFQVQCNIHSSSDTQGELILLKNNILISSQTIQLHAGKNSFLFKDSHLNQGLALYKAIINVPEDNFFQNNEGLAFSKGTRKSEILYISNKPGDSTHPFLALQKQGLNITHKNIKELSLSIQNLSHYNAVILDNPSGNKFSYSFMENLESYVKDMGGGFIMLGGDAGFGTGEFLKTPIEKALPVYMDIPSTLNLSGICIVLIIDKSSSMATTYQQKSKLAMANIAAFSTVELLNPVDMVGIVAFDTEYRWIVPITRNKDRKEIARQLTSLKEEGGTDLYPALKDVFKELYQQKVTKKHIIILSDGVTEEADFKTLVQTMKENQISVSTVAVGSGADVNLMKDIAQWGGGRGYYTDNPQLIPRIFTDETKIVSKKLVIEKTLQPTVTMNGELLAGIPHDSLPLVHGHLLTYPKPWGDVLIKTEEGPLLVTGQYGLGRSVIFTSDLAERWGKEWIQWDGYEKFLTQMVKWAQRKETPRRYTAMPGKKGDQGIFTLDVTNEQHRFINNLTLRIKVLTPQKKSMEIPMDQTAPGRYRAMFPAKEIGEYYITLFDDNPKGTVHSEVFGFALPYTDEFTNRDINYSLLERLASITDGSVLSPKDKPGSLFSASPNTKNYSKPFWPYLVILFLFLLVGDVALRFFFKPVQ